MPGSEEQPSNAYSLTAVTESGRSTVSSAVQFLKV